VHGDLWYGSAAITNEITEEGIVFDPAGFWSHNECMHTFSFLLFHSFFNQDRLHS
jgi:fructosamine-3-kinase